MYEFDDLFRTHLCFHLFIHIVIAALMLPGRDEFLFLQFQEGVLEFHLFHLRTCPPYILGQWRNDTFLVVLIFPFERSPAALSFLPRSPAMENQRKPANT